MARQRARPADIGCLRLTLTPVGLTGLGCRKAVKGKLDKSSQLGEPTMKEMTRPWHDDDGFFLVLGKSADGLKRNNLIVLPVNKGAGVTQVGRRKPGHRQPNQDAGLKVDGHQTEREPSVGPLVGNETGNRSTERKATHPATLPDQPRIAGLGPLPGRPEVFLLTFAVGMAALAFSNPTKIGAYADQTLLRKGANKGLDHLVIEVATKEGMGMGNDGKAEGLTCLPGLIDGQLQVASRTLNDEAFSLGVQTVVGIRFDNGVRS